MIAEGMLLIRYSCGVGDKDLIFLLTTLLGCCRKQVEYYNLNYFPEWITCNRHILATIHKRCSKMFSWFERTFPVTLNYVIFIFFSLYRNLKPRNRVDNFVLASLQICNISLITELKCQLNGPKWTQCLLLWLTAHLQYKIS